MLGTPILSIILNNNGTRLVRASADIVGRVTLIRLGLDLVD